MARRMPTSTRPMDTADVLRARVRPRPGAASLAARSSSWRSPRRRVIAVHPPADPCPGAVHRRRAAARTRSPGYRHRARTAASGCVPACSRSASRPPRSATWPGWRASILGHDVRRRLRRRPRCYLAATSCWARRCWVTMVRARSRGPGGRRRRDRRAHGGRGQRAAVLEPLGPTTSSDDPSLTPDDHQRVRRSTRSRTPSCSPWRSGSRRTRDARGRVDPRFALGVSSGWSPTSGTSCCA